MASVQLNIFLICVRPSAHRCVKCHMFKNKRRTFTAFCLSLLAPTLVILCFGFFTGGSRYAQHVSIVTILGPIITFITVCVFAMPVLLILWWVQKLNNLTFWIAPEVMALGFYFFGRNGIDSVESFIWCHIGAFVWGIVFWVSCRPFNWSFDTDASRRSI